MKITKLFCIFLAVESSKSQSWGLRKRARKEQKFLRGEKGDFFIYFMMSLYCLIIEQSIFYIHILIQLMTTDGIK